MNNAEIKGRYLALAKYVAGSMVKVEDRDEIQMRGTWDRGQLTIEIKVPDSYRGLFIGRSGHMVRSLRGLLAAASLDLPGSVAFDIA